MQGVQGGTWLVGFSQDCADAEEFEIVACHGGGDKDERCIGHMVELECYSKRRMGHGRVLVIMVFAVKLL